MKWREDTILSGTLWGLWKLMSYQYHVRQTLITDSPEYIWQLRSVSLSFWHHSGLQHPQDIICVTGAIRHRPKLKSMLCVHDHLLASVISETVKNELYPLIYSETYHPDSPHLILFYNTGCLCLCLHWLQIIVMHRVWVVFWNVKCKSISAQWFCVVEGSVVLWCGVRRMMEERNAASLKQFLIHIILTLKQDYFITTSSTATKTTLDLPI